MIIFTMHRMYLTGSHYVFVNNTYISDEDILEANQICLILMHIYSEFATINTVQPGMGLCIWLHCLDHCT